jgi:DNA-binding transcriptional MocR family regulator
MGRQEGLDNEIRLHLYGRFVEDGRPPTVPETAEALGMSEREASRAYRRLADAHVIVLEPGTDEVWMAAPLSARPTPFPVRTADGREYFGNCSWDAPGVLAMLSVDGIVETLCPDCGDPLGLEIREGELQPVRAVGHFAVPAAQWWDDIGYT